MCWRWGGLGEPNLLLSQDSLVKCEVCWHGKSDADEKSTGRESAGDTVLCYLCLRSVKGVESLRATLVNLFPLKRYQNVRNGSSFNQCCWHSCVVFIFHYIERKKFRMFF